MITNSENTGTPKNLILYLKSMSGGTVNLRINGNATCEELTELAGKEAFKDKDFFTSPGCCLVYKRQPICRDATPIKELGIQDHTTILFTARVIGNFSRRMDP